MALGFSPEGIDFNAPDGQPARVVFLLLMPPRAHDQEVRILAQIARAVIEPDARARLLQAKSVNEVLALVSAHSPRAESMTPRRASLADI
jgi:PTS system fructose-specific IIC component